MAYPFYLGEGLATAAAARDAGTFVGLAKRNFDVIMNTHSQSGTMRKLRVAQLESLISRAVYRSGANPERLFALSMECLDQIRKVRVQQREELKNVLLNFCSSSLRLLPEFPCAHPSLLQRFLREVEQNQDRKVTVAAVAARLRVSPSHLSRVIKASTGRHPHEHIRLWKLGRAREKLAETSVTQAALESGFGKVSAFIELFRKHYGETPGAYKRRLITGLPQAFPGCDQIPGTAESNRGIQPPFAALS